MKITFASVKFAAIAAVLLAFTGGSALAVTDPIPGVDVIVKKNGLAVHATTDKAGNFVFAKLEEGKYQLSVEMPPQTKTPLSSGKSIIKLNRKTENQAGILDVTIMLGKEQPKAIAIEIPKDGGKIVGIVKKASEPVKTDATSAPGPTGAEKKGASPAGEVPHQKAPRKREAPPVQDMPKPDAPVQK